MRIHHPFVVVAIAALPFTSAAEISAEEAHGLPVEALAQKVLGEVGRLMVEVDRPRFADSVSELKFYSRASVPGSQFGLCAADWVLVSFNKTGDAINIKSDRRFGVAGNIYPKSSNWTYEQAGSICAAVQSTRLYFPAPDPQDALNIARYVDAVLGKGPFAGQQFPYRCASGCGKEDRDDLRWLKLERIDSARAIECPASRHRWPSCYELTVGENRTGPFPKKFKIYGTASGEKVVVDSVEVDVGATLE